MNRPTSFVFASACFVLAAFVPASAQSVQPAPPAATAAQPGGGRQAMAACRDDMKALCAGVEKGGGRKIACLKDNQAKLSTGCQAAIQSVLDKRGAGNASGGAVTGGGKVGQVCQADIAAKCANVGAGHGAVGKCLNDKASSVSQPCQAALAEMNAKTALRQQAKQLCANDATNLCPMLKGKEQMSCLQEKAATATPSCRQALAQVPMPKVKP